MDKKFLAENGVWFNGYGVLSYNCLFNFVQSMRGPGKTYWFKTWAISDFLKTGRQFIYLRRYKTEIKEARKDFCVQIANEFPDHELSLKGDTVLVDDKPAGRLMALSTNLTQKSGNFQRISKINYDEFTLPRGSYHYLSGEVDQFLSLYDSINRIRDPRDEVIVFFTANNMGFNPYFDYYKISFKAGQNICRPKTDVFALLWDNPEYVKYRQNTRFGKLIEGTSYGDHATHGEVYDKDDLMIKVRPKDSIFWYNLYVCKQTYGVWGSLSEQVLVVSKTFDPCGRTFALSRPDVAGGTVLALPRDRRLDSLRLNYKNGLIYYETPQIKNVVAPAIARLVR